MGRTLFLAGDRSSLALAGHFEEGRSKRVGPFSGHSGSGTSAFSFETRESWGPIRNDYCIGQFSWSSNSVQPWSHELTLISVFSLGLPTTALPFKNINAWCSCVTRATSENEPGYEATNRLCSRLTPQNQRKPGPKKDLQVPSISWLPTRNRRQPTAPIIRVPYHRSLSLSPPHLAERRLIAIGNRLGVRSGVGVRLPWPLGPCLGRTGDPQLSAKARRPMKPMLERQCRPKKGIVQLRVNLQVVVLLWAPLNCLNSIVNFPFYNIVEPSP